MNAPPDSIDAEAEVFGIVEILPYDSVCESRFVFDGIVPGTRFTGSRTLMAPLQKSKNTLSRSEHTIRYRMFTERQGRTPCRDQIIDGGLRDVFVGPSWHAFLHAASDNAVLFATANRPIQEKPGLFRDQKGNQ